MLLVPLHQYQPVEGLGQRAHSEYCNPRRQLGRYPARSSLKRQAGETDIPGNRPDGVKGWSTAMIETPPLRELPTAAQIDRPHDHAFTHCGIAVGQRRTPSTFGAGASSFSRILRMSRSHSATISSFDRSWGTERARQTSTQPLDSRRLEHHPATSEHLQRSLGPKLPIEPAVWRPIAENRPNPRGMQRWMIELPLRISPWTPPA